MNSIDENDRAIQEKISQIFNLFMIEYMIFFKNFKILKSDKDDGSLEKWTRWTKVGSRTFDFLSRDWTLCRHDDVMMTSSWRNDWIPIRRKEQINKQEKEAGVKYVKTLVEKHNSQKVWVQMAISDWLLQNLFSLVWMAIFDPKFRHNWKQK